MAFKMKGWSPFTYETNPDGTPREGGKTWGMSKESGPLTSNYWKKKLETEKAKQEYDHYMKVVNRKRSN